MTVHAFVDESQRGSRYYLAAAIVEPAKLGPTRRAMRSLLMPGQREIHFKQEKPERRRRLADIIAALPVEVHIYHRSYHRRDEPARQECLMPLIRDLLAIDAHRLVIDSREDRNAHDERTIRTALGGHRHSTKLVYEHAPSTSETLLWIADVAVWCYGAGGDWRIRIKSIIGAVQDLDYP
jgi:hypothetical protein